MIECNHHRWHTDPDDNRFQRCYQCGAFKVKDKIRERPLYYPDLVDTEEYTYNA